MAEVLSAVLGQEIEAKRKALPESLTGMSLSKDVPMAHEPTRKAARPRFREEVMAELTHSAPGAKYVADDAGDAFEGGSTPAPIVADPYDATRGAVPSKRPSQTPTPILAQEGGAAGMSPERKIALAALGLAFIAVVGAGAVVVVGLGGDPPPAPVEPAAQSPREPEPSEAALVAGSAAAVEPSSASVDAGTLAAVEPEVEPAESEAGEERPRTGMRRRGSTTEASEPTMMSYGGVLIVDDDSF
jgi:hypothetical protein